MSRENPQYTIFVVDDENEVAEVIQKYLHREGFHSARAASGAEAMSWLSENHADLMLLDFKLPDMTAEDLVETLSEWKLLIPFIIITGLGDERVAVEMMKRGARDYLIKDASLMKLLPSVVTQLLEQLEGEKGSPQPRKPSGSRNRNTAHCSSRPETPLKSRMSRDA